MRILIVNGYGNSEKGKLKYDKYCDMIRKVGKFIINYRHSSAKKNY